MSYVDIYVHIYIIYLYVLNSIWSVFECLDYLVVELKLRYTLYTGHRATNYTVQWVATLPELSQQKRYWSSVKQLKFLLCRKLFYIGICTHEFCRGGRWTVKKDDFDARNINFYIVLKILIPEVLKNWSNIFSTSFLNASKILINKNVMLLLRKIILRQMWVRLKWLGFLIVFFMPRSRS